MERNEPIHGSSKAIRQVRRTNNVNRNLLVIPDNHMPHVGHENSTSNHSSNHVYREPVQQVTKLKHRKGK